MSNKNYDGQNDHDYENQEELAWNEFDWQKYLKNNEQEIQEFLKLYHKLKNKQVNFYEIAKALSCELEEKSQDEGDDTQNSASKLFDLQENTAADSDTYWPYTIHKHPIYIVTRGLYKYVYQCWECLLLQPNLTLKPVDAFRLSSSLQAGEINALMAIHSLDFSELNLTVCQLKQALDALNHTMGKLQHFSKNNPSINKFLANNMLPALFDLREVFIQVMTECREEVRYQDSDVD